MVIENRGPKIRQEQETIRLMVYLYCRCKHQTKAIYSDDQLCADCLDLLNYAQKRLSMCRFGEQKTTCKLCPKHCYRSDYKARVKEVMRFSGPRMLIYHPTKALLHMYKSLVRAN